MSGKAAAVAPAVYSRRAEASWLALVVMTLAWGVLAFGSNYPWAYTPLFASALLAGVMGLLVGRDRSVAINVVVALTGVAVATAVQLLPLPMSVLESVSPAAVSLLSQHDLSVGTGVAVSHPLSIEPSRTALALTFFISLSLLVAGVSRGLTRESARQLALAVTTLSVAVALIGLVQQAAFNGKIYGFWQPYEPNPSPFGPFVNRNHFAGWMLMALPVSIGVFAATIARAMRGVKHSWRHRLLWLGSNTATAAVLSAFAVITISVALVFTTSRSGLLGFVGALVLSTVIMGRRLEGQHRVFIKIFGLVVLVGTLSWIGLDRVGARFSHDQLQTGPGRIAIWRDTIAMMKDFPLTGTGLNTFGVATFYYRDAMPVRRAREAHNEYLQLAAEGGVLVCVPILAAIAAFVVAVRRRLRADQGSIWWIRMGAILGLLAVAVQSLVDFSLQIPANAVLFTLLAGLALHNSAANPLRVSARSQ